MDSDGSVAGSVDISEESRILIAKMASRQKSITAIKRRAERKRVTPNLLSVTHEEIDRYLTFISYH